jgi:prephenate dehydratase
LAQCERFIGGYKLQPIEGFDTAGSAKQLSEVPQKRFGGHCQHKSGRDFELQVLDTEIEDVSYNYTRFLVLGYEDADVGTYNKTSIVFATRHKPAALYACLRNICETQHQSDQS